MNTNINTDQSALGDANENIAFVENSPRDIQVKEKQNNGLLGSFKQIK